MQIKIKVMKKGKLKTVEPHHAVVKNGHLIINDENYRISTDKYWDYEVLRYQGKFYTTEVITINKVDYLALKSIL